MQCNTVYVQPVHILAILVEGKNGDVAYLRRRGVHVQDIIGVRDFQPGSRRQSDKSSFTQSQDENNATTQIICSRNERI